MNRQEREDRFMGEKIESMGRQIERMFLSLRGREIDKKHLKRIFRTWMTEFMPFCYHLKDKDVEEVLHG